jgi:hypothetical protein
MTINEWRENVTLASELKQLLEHPTLKAALSVLADQTMAKTLNGPSLTQLADKAVVLFGYDVGLNAAITDLHNLAITPEEIEEPIPSYQEQF